MLKLREPYPVGLMLHHVAGLLFVGKSTPQPAELLEMVTRTRFRFTTQWMVGGGRGREFAKMIAGSLVTRHS